jgi:radical SAM protein with 4Fe4S-binding SPASM domain
MNFVDFKKIVDKILPNYPSIKLLVITGFGEPLLDRDIIEKIKYVNHKYPQIKIDLYTNGALLRKEIAEELLKTHIHKINFSINALQKDYKEIMGLDYPTVENNILYFTEKKKSLKKIFPLVNFSLMILKKNAEDTKKFIDLWKTRGDSVMTYMPLEWAGDKKVETIAEVKMNKKRWACIPLWQNIMVDVNGDIIMCCQDYESKVKFGNVLNESIKKIMNSEKFIKIREMQKKGIYNMPLCDSCDNWVNSSFSWWHYN